MKTNMLGVGLRRLEAMVRPFHGLLTITAIAGTLVTLLIFKPLSAQASPESIMQDQVTQLKRIADALEKIAGTRQR